MMGSNKNFEKILNRIIDEDVSGIIGEDILHRSNII